MLACSPSPGLHVSLDRQGPAQSKTAWRLSRAMFGVVLLAVLTACSIDPFEACVREKREAAVLADPGHKASRGDFELAAMKMECRRSLGIDEDGKPLPTKSPPDTRINPVDRLTALAMQGDPQSQFELGERFADGNGVPKDPVEAHAWHEKAAHQGWGTAQARLAEALMNEGPQQDKVAGYAWAILASRDGATVAPLYESRTMARFRDHMTFDEIQAATALANRWKPGQPLTPDPRSVGPKA